MWESECVYVLYKKKDKTTQPHSGMKGELKEGRVSLLGGVEQTSCRDPGKRK